MNNSNYQKNDLHMICFNYINNFNKNNHNNYLNKENNSLNNSPGFGN